MTRILPFLLSLSAIHAASARVKWQPNPETDIAGYRLQWSADGEPLGEVETAGLAAEVDDLKPGVAYAFRLCAVNTSGMRSGWSEATTYTVPTNTVTYTLQLGNDLTGWFDAASVTITSPTQQQFARIKITKR